MRHVRLISFYDEITGELGLGVKGHTSHPSIFSDRNGQLIAHDIVEHQNGMAAIGSWHDELEAMGACWHVRGRNGVDIGNRYYSPEQAIAHDILSIAVDFDREEDPGIYPRLHRYNTKPHDCDEDFELILETAKPLIERELSDNEHPFPIEPFLDNALHLMRTGYRKSARRWG